MDNKCCYDKNQINKIKVLYIVFIVLWCLLVWYFNLYKTLDLVDAEVRKEYLTKNYSGSLKLLCKLKNPIDQFFNDVMVNAEDESLKMNRLALLEKLYSAMNLVADLSKLSY